MIPEINDFKKLIEERTGEKEDFGGDLLNFFQACWYTMVYRQVEYGFQGIRNQGFDKVCDYAKLKIDRMQSIHDNNRNAATKNLRAIIDSAGDLANYAAILYWLGTDTWGREFIPEGVRDVNRLLVGTDFELADETKRIELSKDSLLDRLNRNELTPEDRDQIRHILRERDEH